MDLWVYKRFANVPWLPLGSLQARKRTQYCGLLQPHGGRLAVEGFFPPHTSLLCVASDTVPAESPACAPPAIVNADERGRERALEQPR